MPGTPVLETVRGSTARGEYAGPPLPPANDHLGQWIVVGPRTRAHLARVLEQSLAPVLVALLETSGVPEGQGCRLVVDSCHLSPRRRREPAHTRRSGTTSRPAAGTSGRWATPGSGWPATRWTREPGSGPA